MTVGVTAAAAALLSHAAFAWAMGRIPDLTTRETLLASPQRRAILDLVRQRPGIPLGEIMRTLNLGWGTVSYHVAKLCASGLLRTQVVGRRRLVHAAGPGAADLAVLSLLQGKTVRRIATAIAVQPGQSVLDLCESLQETPRVVYYHLKHLEQAGLVEARPQGRSRRLHATPRLVDLLDRLASAPPPPAPADGTAP